MKALAWLLVFFVVPALAGCSDSPAEQDPQDPDSDPPIQPPTEDPPLPPINSTANTTSLPPIILSQCTGFRGSTLPYARPLGPGQAPPGWEPENPAVLVSYVGLAGYECQRMHVGPYERGPIRMVWDDHDNVDTPSKCLEGRTGRHTNGVLNVVLIDNHEIADYLVKEYGLPIQYADIEIQTETAGPVKQHTWTWGPGETKSQIRITDDETSNPYDSGERLFWQWKNGIGRLDFSYVRDGFAYTTRDGEGFMESPMLLSSEVTNAFVGPIWYFPSMSGEGEIQLFEDLLCEKPVDDS